jgi:hypothetical protein
VVSALHIVSGDKPRRIFDAAIEQGHCRKELVRALGDLSPQFLIEYLDVSILGFELVNLVGQFTVELVSSVESAEVFSTQ